MQFKGTTGPEYVTAANPLPVTLSGTISPTITDDTTTNATMYLTWVTAATGNLPIKVSTTKISFNPATGALTVSGPGSFAALTASGLLTATGGIKMPTATPINFNVGSTTYIQEVSAGVMQFVAGSTQFASGSATGVTFASLAGTGTRTVVADANGKLSAP